MKKKYYTILCITALLITASCSTDSTPVYQLTASAEPIEAGSVAPTSGEFDDGSTVVITATPNEHWIFDSWQGGLTGNTNPANVTMNSDKNITALFIKREYPLTVNIDGEGTVSERVIQAKTTDYPHGTIVELTANPADGWVFIEWGDNLEGSENPTSITVEEEISITAKFKSINELLSIVVEGEGIVEIAQESASENPSRTQIVLTVNPADGWEFVEWLEDLDGTESQKTLTIDSEKNATAVFERIEYTVNATVEGAGTLTITPEQDFYFWDDEITIEVETEDGWNFVFWDGDLEGTENPIQVTINQNITATANLDESPFEGGDGSNTYPYQVSTIEQLQTINDFTDSHFVQINDIDANDTGSWNGGNGFKPIGDEIIRFTGSFNGNGFEISGLTINREDEDYIGLFGSTQNALIDNIVLVNATISGQNFVGGLVGYSDQGEISDSHVTGTISATYNTGGLVGEIEAGIITSSHSNGEVIGSDSHVGGLAGHNNRGEINDSHSASEVSGGASTMGGLVGYNNDAIIDNSYSTGKVSGLSNFVGGLAGSNFNGEINNSYASGEVSGDGDWVGGLVGYNIQGNISNSYASGHITGNQNNVGGLLGFSESGGVISNSFSSGNVSGVDKVGGLIGENQSTQIINSYALGSVTGENEVGGLAGLNHSSGEVITSYASGRVMGAADVGGLIGLNGAVVESSYWDIEATEQSDGIGRGSSSGATGLITSQMTNASAEGNMPGFDWVNHWKTSTGYPILIWQD